MGMKTVTSPPHIHVKDAGTCCTQTAGQPKGTGTSTKQVPNKPPVNTNK